MLILSRKEDQKIRIGNDVVIHVISISDGNVRIGIQADKNIKIYREEVYEAIKLNNKEAAGNLTEIVPTGIDKLKLNKIKK